MRNTKQEFPHPLLSEARSDYITGSFSLNVENQSSDAKDFTFRFRYLLDCAGLESLVKEGQAAVVLRVSSSAASFRAKADFDTKSHTCTVVIGKQKVAKSVSVQAFVVVTEKIDAFSLPEHNPLYFKGSSFDLRKGDILAESVVFEIKLDDSEMEKPLSSIFQISQNDDATESYVANYAGHKIRVFLSPRLYAVYHNLRKKGEFRRYLSAVLILPALTEALTKMQSEPDEESGGMESLRWYRAIENKLRKINVDILETTLPMATIANQLLGDIAWDALNSFKTTIDDINTNSETIELERGD